MCWLVLGLRIAFSSVDWHSVLRGGSGIHRMPTWFFWESDPRVEMRRLMRMEKKIEQRDWQLLVVVLVLCSVYEGKVQFFEKGI